MQSGQTGKCSGLAALGGLAIIMTIIMTSVAAEWPDSIANCVSCHDGSRQGEEHVLQILSSPHGVMADSRTGMATTGCAGCHGPSTAHARLPESIGGDAPDIVFQGPGASPVGDKNRMCLDCHGGRELRHWHGSEHEFADLACVACHGVHVIKDPAMDRHLQAEQCVACHQRQVAEFHRPFAHPLRHGEMVCTDCHNPHGGPGPGMLASHTINENCTSCHAEMRGPFLWEHAPVREDCTLCHQPHGSMHRDMLTARTPFLCQQCHMGQFHPSAALSGTGLPGPARPSGSDSMLGRDCMNCHVQVHGSNHPAGVGQTR